MNILSIDCSTGLKLALNAGGKWYQFVDESAQKQSDSLLEKIDTIVKKANIKIKDVDVIAVCVGPGSFTGIRVAISTAKGLAIGIGAKVVTFSSFDTVENLPQNNYAVVVSGFGNNYYYKIKKFGRVFQGCGSLESLKNILSGVKIFTNTELVKTKNPNFEIVVAGYDSAKVVLEMINQDKFISTSQIAPLYLRASQAELERQKNGNKV